MDVKVYHNMENLSSKETDLSGKTHMRSALASPCSDAEIGVGVVRDGLIGRRLEGSIVTPVNSYEFPFPSRLSIFARPTTQSGVSPLPHCWRERIQVRVQNRKADSATHRGRRIFRRERMGAEDRKFV
jgi:hypothetical protein